MERGSLQHSAELLLAESQEFRSVDDGRGVRVDDSIAPKIPYAVTVLIPPTVPVTEN